MAKINSVLDEIEKLSQDKRLLDLTLLNIDVWPLIKRDVYLKGLHDIRGKKRTSIETKLYLIWKFKDGLLSFLKWFLLGEECRKIILSYSTFNRSKINGLWTDPYTEYFTHFESGWQRLEVAHRGIRKKPTEDNVEVPTALFLFAKIFSPIIRLYMLMFYSKQINKIYAVSPITVNSVIDIYFYGLFWRQILRHKKINKVGIVGWNQNISVGLNYAAVKLNIPVFEVVHGKVWKGKPMSTGFEQYYNCLPDELIVTDEIQGEIVSNTNTHLKARVQSNVYRLLIDNDSSYDIASRETLEAITGNQQYITVCLGHDDLSSHLFNALKRVSGYKLMLRPHPGFGNIHEYDTFQNIQKLLLTKDAAIVDVSTISLNSMLRNTKCLFAFGSTTLIDAVANGVPAVLMDEAYAIQFEDYINIGVIKVWKKGENINTILESLT